MSNMISDLDPTGLCSYRSWHCPYMFLCGLRVHLYPRFKIRPSINQPSDVRAHTKNITKNIKKKNVSRFINFISICSS